MEEFQFQTGSIKSKALNPIDSQPYSFNSKLVRLKVLGRFLFQSFIPEFQFQTGSIKRQLRIRNDMYKKCFNSKLVRLKVWEQMRAVDSVLDRFNSKLVRLKAANRLQVERYRFASFNSKLVRLKEILLEYPVSAKQRFNSKLVRLKGFRPAALPLRFRKFQFQTGSIKSENNLLVLEVN